MKFSLDYVPCYLASAVLVIMAAPSEGEASTKVSGNFSLQSAISSEGNRPMLLESGVNLQLIPALRKVNTRINIPLRFTYTSTSEEAQLSPTGNFGVDMTGESYNLNLQYGRFISVSNQAELTDSRIYQAGLSLMPAELPKLFATVSRTESTTSGKATGADTATVFANYNYWRTDFSTGYTITKFTPTDQLASTVNFRLARVTEIVRSTTLATAYDFSHFVTDYNNTGQENITSTTHTFNIGLNSTPIEWLNLNANYYLSNADSSATKSNQQVIELTPSFLLLPNLKFSPSTGIRSFDDAGRRRNVRFYGAAADYSASLQEKILLGLHLSRFYENDPEQGQDIRDKFGLNSVLDLFPGVAVRFNFDILRRDNAEFVNTRFFDASGTLAERDALAAFGSSSNLTSGYIFFDSVLNDLYTLIDPATASTAAVWSAPVHFEPIRAEFTVTKNIKINMIPTERTTLSLDYTSSAQSDRLDVSKIGSQTINGAFTYMPNRRTNINLSGTASYPEGETRRYSVVGGVSYYFLRGQNLNLSFSYPTGDKGGTLFGGFSIPLRKRANFGITYSISKFLANEQNYYVNFILTKSF